MKPQTHLASLELLDGAHPRSIPIDHAPFVIGRSPECSLVLPQTFVSRRHAEITGSGTHFLLRDLGSLHGTFVNRTRVVEHLLLPFDIVQFGSHEGPQLQFGSGGRRGSATETMTQTLLGDLQQMSPHTSDMEKLRWFLHAARQLNRAGAVEQIFSSLLEIAITLARVERGYIFLLQPDGNLHLKLGLDAHGAVLENTSAVSRTVIRQAIAGTAPFVVTDTATAEGPAVPQSIAAGKIRTVICLPLREVRQPRARKDAHPPNHRRVFGVLYLDSQFEPTRFSEIDHDLLHMISREAAALVENAQLAAIEEQARQDNEELEIAAAIQKGLMAVKLPALPFASIETHSTPCRAVGGDFFDVLFDGSALSIALVDVSGKGIAAAILASTLQGMLYLQLEAGRPLDAIAATINRYLCAKDVGKYATMLLLRLRADGHLEYINCGHIQPRVCSGEQVLRLTSSNLPVGLLPEATYAAETARMEAGSRLILVSDGFTEAEDAHGESFGEDRLDTAARCTELQSILRHMLDFCAAHPLTDDCTVLQIAFQPPAP